MSGSALALAEPMAEHHHQVTCVNHKRFASYGAALAHYIEQLRQNRCDPGQDVFKCSRCRGYHHGGGIVSLERRIREAEGRHDDA